MIFNKNNYPFLQKFKNDEIDVFSLFDDSKGGNRESVSDVFKETVKNLKDAEVTPTYYSDFVYSKIKDEQDKISSLISNVGDDTGIILLSLSKDKSKTIHNTIFYTIVQDPSGGGVIFSCYWFTGDILLFSTLIRYDKEEKRWQNTEMFPYVENNMIVLDVCTLVLFKQFAVEHKEFKLKSRTKQKNRNGKYRNELYSDINVIDKTYFTSIYNFNKFSVNGHFRNQPYGKNRSKRKLIWVEEFIKKGYSRSAKIANDQH